MGEGGLELLVIVRHVDAHGQTAQHEESGKAVEDGVVGPRHHDSGVFCLSSCHTDVIRPGDGETSLDQALQEAEETTEIAGLVQLRERAGIAPVAEPEAVVQRVGAEHGDEGVQDQADDKDDFAEREPEFRLAVPLDSEDVDQSTPTGVQLVHLSQTLQNQSPLPTTKKQKHGEKGRPSPIKHDNNRNDRTRRHGGTPIMNDDVASDDLKRHERGFEDEEVVACCHAEGFVDVAAGEADEGRGDGEVGYHFCHA